MISQSSIFIVEDNLASQLLYRELFGHLGYECNIWHSAEEILEAIKTTIKKPIAILMDIGLPGISGVECLQAIRLYYPNMSSVPIVAITAHVMIHEIKEYKDRGFNDVLQKPVKCCLLKEIMKKHEQQQGMQRCGSYLGESI